MNQNEVLISKYGIQAAMNTQGVPTKLNQRFFAGLFLEKNQILYDPVAKKFLLYSPESGLFGLLTEDRLKARLGTLIHEFGVQQSWGEFDMLITDSTLSAISRLLRGMAENCNEFDAHPHVIHCMNTILEYEPSQGKFLPKPFDPNYRCTTTLPVQYVPEATAPEFLEKLLAPAMTKDDMDLFQLYAGQCLLGKNYSQTFLLITGTAAGGKSTLSKIIETMIGKEKCIGLRIEKLNGNFEIGRCRGKTLLTGKDVDSKVLSCAGARNIKSLTGGDPQSGELKNSNEIVDIHGTFNIIIVSNAFLRVEFDSDIEAWRRRILWINFEKPPLPLDKRITDYDQVLIRKEGSGILNWMLTGAERLLSNGGKIYKTSEQMIRVDSLMKSSDGVKIFVQHCVKPKVDSDVSIAEMVYACNTFFDKMRWTRFSERVIQQHLKTAMEEIHHRMSNVPVTRHGTRIRGYQNFQIVPPTEKYV